MAIVISWHGAKRRKNQGQGNVFICSRALRTERNGAERGKNEWHSFIDLDFYDWNRVCVSKNDIEIQRGHLGLTRHYLRRNGAERLSFCLAVHFIDNHVNENITTPFRSVMFFR